MELNWMGKFQIGVAGEESGSFEDRKDFMAVATAVPNIFVNSRLPLEALGCGGSIGALRPGGFVGVGICWPFPSKSGSRGGHFRCLHQNVGSSLPCCKFSAISAEARCFSR